MENSSKLRRKWEVARSPFFGASTLRSATTKDQRYVNIYIDRIENSDTGSARFFITKRPGTTLYTNPPLAAATARGAYSWNSNLYSVFGTKIYKGTTDLGVTLTTSTGMVAFSETSAIATTRYLAVTDGVKLYLIQTTDTVTTIQNGQVQEITITAGGSAYASAPTVSFSGGGGSGVAGTATISGGAVTGVTITNRGSGYTSAPTVSFSGGGGSGAAADAALCGLPSSFIADLEFMDGYLLLCSSDGKLFNSNLEDPTLWGAATYVQAQKYPDNLVGLSRQNDTVMAFGTQSTEFFYDAANAAPASFLGSLTQGTFQIGCASKDTIVHQENFVLWVAAAGSGGYTVQKLDGISNLKKVSTDPIERIISAEGSSISSARATALRICGHFFYVLTLTSADRTFVFDIDEERWFEWQSGTSGAWDYVAALEHNGSVYIQHQSDGKLYQMSQSEYTDDGTDIEVILQTAPIDYDTQHRKFYKRFELFGDLQDDYCPLTIYYSDDNYKTWSVGREVNMKYRSWLSQLGSSRRRAWKVTHTHDGPLRLEGFETEYQEGSY